MAKNNSSHKVQRESKEHYKMYKAGKQWLFAAIFSVMVGTGLATQTHVSAATDDGDTQAQETTDPANAELQQQTVKLSNFADTAKTESTSTAATAKDDAAATTPDSAADDTMEAAEAAPAADKTTTDDALNTKTVKRTINFVDENGKTVASPVVQQVQFTRSNAESEWVATGHAQFDALSTPNVLGMTTTTKIAATNVHATDDDSTLTVTYTETSADSRAKALAAAPKAAVTYKAADAVDGTSDDKTDGPVVSTITAEMAQNLFVTNDDSTWDGQNDGTAKMVKLGNTDAMGSPIGSNGNIMMANRIDVRY
jgi:hypothetical protein